MGISNLVAFFIILTTAVTLHAHGMTDIQTAAQAADALKPIAGAAAFLLFSLGIDRHRPAGRAGAGRLRGLCGGRAAGLARPGWSAAQARRGFYLRDRLAIVLGMAVDFSPLDPIKALFWSAVINGVIVVPIMVAMMIVASRRTMGDFVASPWQVVLGWAATAVMAAAAVAMFVPM